MTCSACCQVSSGSGKYLSRRWGWTMGWGCKRNWRERLRECRMTSWRWGWPVTLLDSDPVPDYVQYTYSDRLRPNRTDKKVNCSHPCFSSALSHSRLKAAMFAPHKMFLTSSIANGPRSEYTLFSLIGSRWMRHLLAERRTRQSPFCPLCLKILTFGSREDSVHIWLETRRGDRAVRSLLVGDVVYISIDMERVSPDMHKEIIELSPIRLRFVSLFFLGGCYEMASSITLAPILDRQPSLPVGNETPWHGMDAHIIVLAANSVRTLPHCGPKGATSPSVHHGTSAVWYCPVVRIDHARWWCRYRICAMGTMHEEIAMPD